MKDYSLAALNGHLHDQIARLTNPDLNKEDLQLECERSKSLSILAQGCTEIASITLKAADMLPANSAKDVIQPIFAKPNIKEVGHA